MARPTGSTPLHHSTTWRYRLVEIQRLLILADQAFAAAGANGDQGASGRREYFAQALARLDSLDNRSTVRDANTVAKEITKLLSYAFAVRAQS
ncbi:MAG TPA: hypothetical protein PKZ27_03135 [Rhodocyclaceae bacterium]|nr:hypothetical protein [Rhodocyclaceae bacterium]